MHNEIFICLKTRILVLTTDELNLQNCTNWENVAHISALLHAKHADNCNVRKILCWPIIITPIITQQRVFQDLRRSVIILQETWINSAVCHYIH